MGAHISKYEQQNSKIYTKKILNMQKTYYAKIIYY